MAIFTNTFRNKNNPDDIVIAGEITESLIAEVVGVFYEYGATLVSVSRYNKFPLDKTSTDLMTSLTVAINGRTYTAIMRDYIVWEETEFGEVVYPTDRQTFQNTYEVV